MLLLVISFQALGVGFMTGANPWIPKSGQFLGITFTIQDRANYGQPSQPRDVTNDVMNLQIHLVQRLLHMLDVASRQLHQCFSVGAVPLKKKNLLGGTERWPQQTDRMKILEPLTI